MIVLYINYNMYLLKGYFMYKTFIKNMSDIVLVLKKSFIELLPYMVIMSFLIVSIQLITIFNLDLNTLKENMVSFVVTIGKFLPILIISFMLYQIKIINYIYMILISIKK